MRQATAIDAGPRPAAEASAIRSAPAWPARVMKRLIGWIAMERRNRRDIHRLAALDERQLADIGLCRLDVERLLPRGSRGFTWEL
jgi:uncharacterized protein YjiS (DUF1127 family)